MKHAVSGDVNTRLNGIFLLTSASLVSGCTKRGLYLMHLVSYRVGNEAPNFWKIQRNLEKTYPAFVDVDILVLSSVVVVRLGQDHMLFIIAICVLHDVVQRNVLGDIHV